MEVPSNIINDIIKIAISLLTLTKVSTTNKKKVLNYINNPLNHYYIIINSIGRERERDENK